MDFYWILRALNFDKWMDAIGEEGQTQIEYALILALLAIVIIGTLTLLGGSLEDTYETIATAIPNSN